MAVYTDEIVADADFGPAMSALEQQKQRFVLCLLEQRGQPNFAEAARSAGYSDHPGTSRVTGHTLIRQPKVIAALHEESRRRFTLAGWQGVLNLIKIAEDDTNRNYFKASKELADRFGYAAVTEHKVTVDHTDLTGQAILEPGYGHWQPSTGWTRPS